MVTKESWRDRWLCSRFTTIDEPDVDYPLHPIVGNFKDTIENSAELLLYFHQMFNKAPEKERTSHHRLEATIKYSVQLLSHALIQKLVQMVCSYVCNTQSANSNITC